MKDYKRFTENVDSGFVSELDCRIAYNKLVGLENKIENGTLQEIPEGSVVLNAKDIETTCKHCRSKYEKIIEELEEQRDRQAYIAEDLIQEKHRWTEQTREEMAREIVSFIESLKVKEDGRHQWRENYNDCIDKVILKINQKFINSVEVEE